MSIPNINVSFLCVSVAETITGIQWLLNGTLLEDRNLTDVRSVFREMQGIGKLFLSRVPLKYNSTNISCRAELTSGQVEVTASLLVQGLNSLCLFMYCIAARVVSCMTINYLSDCVTVQVLLLLLVH